MNAANIPGPGSITLDHSGSFVTDPEAARIALAELGFMVTPWSAQVQPDPDTGEMRLTGTGNICVMLSEGYLEFLAHTADTPLGLEFRAALERRAGLHLAAFGSADAAAEHAALSARGVDMRPLVHFSREIDTETGPGNVAFTVARLAAGTMTEGRVQIVTHHSVPAMWQDRWVRHPNGAIALRSMIVSTPDPEETAARFSRVLNRPATPNGDGLLIDLDRGALEILPEATATHLVGTVVDPGQSCLVALRIVVGDLAPFRDRSGARMLDDGTLALPFAPALGRGCWVFERT
ncbi:VOC family protein [Lutimaribacter marinistellae]|uniref:VOC family protein n=1 Tax=Lutimaribacter marinistellae TaxID=1820329 RepID=A0ABV7TDM8_9RHOB